ncbi:MAG: malonyl-ACP O-methyltransferase BioC [Steroidobacteraceae bacterium]
MSAPNPFELQRAGVRKAFDRAGARYEAAALLQAGVAEELLERLALFALAPQVVLDLGAGTGRVTQRLKRLYRRACVVALDLSPGMLQQAARHRTLLRRFERVCADATRLPLAAQSVDVIFSNLMLQWCDPPDEAFAEARRVLKPRGFFAFSTFGPDTLRELRAAWGEDGRTHVNRFLDMHDVGDALMRMGFSEPVLDVERTIVTYQDALTLMRDLKAIGAHNVTAGRARSLTGKDRLRAMLERYETHRRDGRLPATYEIIYGAAWAGGERTEHLAGPAGGAGPRAAPGSEVQVPLSRIRRRRRP